MTEPAADLGYTAEHEWVAVDGDVATVGITSYAAEKLGDVVFVELPEAGRKVGAGGEIAVVESVKAASDVYAPVSGEVTANNAVLVANPEKVNDDPEGESWFFKLKLADKGELGKLMTAEQYAEFVKGL